jgi:hypothetical protein
VNAAVEVLQRLVDPTVADTIDSAS